MARRIREMEGPALLRGIPGRARRVCRRKVSLFGKRLICFPRIVHLPNMIDTRNPDVLDAARFEMLENSIGPALRPIVVRYITDCEAAIAAIQVSLAAGDHDQVRSVSHRMKGGSSSLGLGRMERGFSELEVAAAQRQEIRLESVAKLSGELRDAVLILRMRGFG